MTNTQTPNLVSTNGSPDDIVIRYASKCGQARGVLNGIVSELESILALSSTADLRDALRSTFEYAKREKEELDKMVI